MSTENAGRAMRDDLHRLKHETFWITALGKYHPDLRVASDLFQRVVALLEGMANRIESLEQEVAKCRQAKS